jgi:hypothetical protein
MIYHEVEFRCWGIPCPATSGVLVRLERALGRRALRHILVA